MPIWLIVILCCVGGVMTCGVLAAIAVPALVKYQRRAKTGEARIQLAKLFDAVLREADDGTCPSDGRFAGSVGPTPPLAVNCNLGPAGRCLPGSNGPGGYPMGLWSDDAVWKTLQMSMDDGHYFHYEYRWEHTDDGRCTVTVTAYGDLDNDGLFSTFERAGQVTPEGVNAAAGIYIDQEIE